MLKKEQFVSYCQSIRDQMNRETQINEFMQTISTEFLYTSNNDLMNNLIECMEGFFPNNVARYAKSGSEDWTSPISVYLYEKDSAIGAPVHFYGASGERYTHPVEDYGNLYDLMVLYERGS